MVHFSQCNRVEAINESGDKKKALSEAPVLVLLRFM